MSNNCLWCCTLVWLCAVLPNLYNMLVRCYLFVCQTIVSYSVFWICSVLVKHFIHNKCDFCQLDIVWLCVKQLYLCCILIWLCAILQTLIICQMSFDCVPNNCLVFRLGYASVKYLYINVLVGCWLFAC